MHSIKAPGASVSTLLPYPDKKAPLVAGTAGNSSSPNSRGRKGDKEQLGSRKGSLEPKPEVGPGVTGFYLVQLRSGARSLQ